MPPSGFLNFESATQRWDRGHFLVNLVDYLADRVLAALAEADTVEGYVSPLATRIRTIRETILGNAKANNWTLESERLDDRHIVRRMILKRCIFGVDKNPMAVELAKVALWLHTITVGAPLSFLDHHLQCGNSLFGSWIYKADPFAKPGGANILLRRTRRQRYFRRTDHSLDRASHRRGDRGRLTSQLPGFKTQEHEPGRWKPCCRSSVGCAGCTHSGSSTPGKSCRCWTGR